MGKLEGKVAVITGGSSGMALASAKRFVEEAAYGFITGRRQEALDEAVKLIGRNVTGVRGDAANLDDLDRLFDTVKREKGKIDILYASAGTGEAVPLGEITEQHFDAAFDLNARGMSNSAEAGPRISAQSGPTPAVEERSSPESMEGTRARRAVPSQATERRAWGGAVDPRGRSAGHGRQFRFLKRQLSLPVSRMSQ